MSTATSLPLARSAASGLSPFVLPLSAACSEVSQPGVPKGASWFRRRSGTCPHRDRCFAGARPGPRPYVLACLPACAGEASASTSVSAARLQGAHRPGPCSKALITTRSRTRSLCPEGHSASALAVASPIGPTHLAMPCPVLAGRANKPGETYRRELATKGGASDNSLRTPLRIDQSPAFPCSDLKGHKETRE